MRDPHNFLWAIILILTPVGWCMAAGYRIAAVIRDALKKGTR